MNFIPVNTPKLGEKERENVLNCIDSGWISSAGEYVSAFEEGFSSYCDCEYGITTTSGTTAIHLALKSLDIGPGDEVLVPSFTMAGSVYPIVQCGATPVFVDSELETCNMDIEHLETKISKRTKAIMPVHIYGHPVDMDPVLALAKKHELFVIEDAAEAHGALYKNKKIGSLGDIACFSFYANKVITTGEGGMVVTNNKELASRARRLKDLAHGDVRFTHDLKEAYNYRMTNIQAAIGCAQLARIEDIISRKIANADLYHELLHGIGGVILPGCKAWARNVYWMYGVRLSDSAGISKETVMAQLEKAGIGSRSFFYPLNEQPAFSEYDHDDCPRAKYLSQQGFYLPSGQALTEAQIRFICKQLKEIMGEKC